MPNSLDSPQQHRASCCRHMIASLASSTPDTSFASLQASGSQTPRPTLRPCVAITCRWPTPSRPRRLTTRRRPALPLPGKAQRPRSTPPPSVRTMRRKGVGLLQRKAQHQPRSRQAAMQVRRALRRSCLSTPTSSRQTQRQMAAAALAAAPQQRRRQRSTFRGLTAALSMPSLLLAWLGGTCTRWALVRKN